MRDNLWSRIRNPFGRRTVQLELHRRTRGGLSWLLTTVQDVRYGVRSLGRSPLFTLTATATLALGLGAVSTVLTVGDALLYRPLPVAHPESVVEVVATRHHGTVRGFVSYPDYEHFRDATTLEGLAAYYPTAPLFVSVGNRAREITGSVVSWNFFPLLGVRPVHGRSFFPSEDRVPGRDRVAVVSHRFSRDWLGGSADALGARIDVNGIAFTVVGVLPPEFHGLHPNPSQVFIPTMMLSAGYRWCEDALAGDCTILRMIGRLGPGQNIESAEVGLAAALPERWAHLAEDGNSGVTVVMPRGIDSGASDRRMVELLAFVSGLLLLVCCANLSGLLAARGAARARELAVRTALGASAGRLARQLLTESMLLAAAGGALGVALAAVMTAALDRWFFSIDNAGRPLLVDFALQPRVVAVILAITVASGLLFGLAPALGAIRAGAAESLKRRSAATGKSGRWVLGAQVALAVVLVSTAGLLVVSARTFVDGRGFDPSHVAQVRLRPRLVAYPPEQAQAFLRTAVERLSALPGVEAVTLIGTGGVLSGLEADVRLPGAADAPARVGSIEVGQHYFEVVGTPVLRGREFASSDRTGSPAVAIVSRSLARLLWAGMDPLDRTILVDGDARRVVGVVDDVSLQTRAEPVRPYVFVPFWQNPSQIDARVAVRVAGDPETALPTLARAVHAVDPAVPISDVVTLPAQLAGSFRSIRMSATVAVYAGGLAMLVSAIGLYGALAFAVSGRTREIGIRMAVGADPRRILRTILGEATPVIVVGVASGLVLAGAAARLLGHVLASAATGDAVAYGGAGLLVACVGLAAGWIPARRAARIEPTAALRQE